MVTGVGTTEVLIIDDNWLTRDSLRMLLELEGYKVSACESGLSAFDLTKEKCFDVLVIDYRMPGMNGDKVTRLLRPSHPEAFIIGYSIEAKEPAFLAAGADVFISKEVLTRELVPLIKKRRQH